MAKYTMQEMNNLNQKGEKLLYPRMIIEHCCETEELAHKISKGTSFGPGEIQAVIELLSEGLALEMANGHSVRIEGIGLFTPSLSLKKGKQREAADGSGTHRNAESIEIGSVNFRPDKELRYKLNRNCELERAPYKFMHRSSRYTPEERLALAQQYLKDHSILTIADYAALTGLSRSLAGNELRQWYKIPETGIDISGRGTHRVYVRKKNDGQ